ncbi:MAG: zinc dependent phospholipase C family protein [Erysipelotrichaceae bacterium]|nr:zinc dependent phospholipase C family protein [Erysipelotrichaceae bacterium]
MPAATTHVECAKDIYDNLPLGKQIVITNKNMFYLGSQGPDLFFFYNFSFSSIIKDTGVYMHEHKIFEVIERMHDYVIKKADYDLLSYYYGYLCHYALDSCAHPLVYQRSRYGNLSDEPEMVIHFKMEAFIDKYVLNSKGRNIKSFDTDKLVTIDGNSRSKLAKMYSIIFKDVFDLEISEKDIEKTCKQIVYTLQILKPNSIYKYKTIQILENIIGKKHLATSLMLFHDFEDPDYVLNNNNLEFINVNDDTLIYTDSFDDLYKQAIEKGVKLITNKLTKDNFKLDFEGKYIKE